MSNNNITVIDVGIPPANLVNWESKEIRYHDFRNLYTERDKRVRSPEFTYRGCQWSLHLYPGGTGESTEGMISVFLFNQTKDKGLSTTYRIEVKNWNGQGSEPGSEPLSSDDTHNFLPYPAMSWGTTS